MSRPYHRTEYGGNDIFSEFLKSAGVSSRTDSLTEIQQRLRAKFSLNMSVDNVWDFGSPSNPRSAEDYVREIGVGSIATVANHNNQQQARKQHEQFNGRAVVTRELLDVLVPLCEGKVVEPFAGHGWLAAHLRHRGVDMMALDNGVVPMPKTWTQIDDLDVVEECSTANVIIMQYPPAHVVTQRIVMRMRMHEMLIYLGPDEWWSKPKLPTPGFWHHLSRSDTDTKLSRKLNKAQPQWSGDRASWQVFIKR